MDNLFSCLQPDGVIVFHELFEQSFEDNQLLRTLGSAKALFDFFNQHEITCLAMPLESGSGLVDPNFGTKKEVLAMSLKHSGYLREESRREV